MKGGIIVIIVMTAMTSCTRQDKTIAKPGSTTYNIAQVSSEDEDAKILMKAKKSGGIIIPNPHFVLHKGLSMISFTGNIDGVAEAEVPAGVYNISINGIIADSVNGVATNIVTVLQSTDTQTFTVIIP